MSAAGAAGLGSRFRAARSQRGWTLADLAREAGISRSAVWQIEHEVSSPTIATAARIAGALDVPLAALVDPGVDTEDWWPLWHLRQGRNHLFEASNHLHKAHDPRAAEVAAALRAVDASLDGRGGS